MASSSRDKPSAFEKLVKAVVSVPKEEVERLRKADRERKRRPRCQPKTD